ncbi:MAG: hypothetical protein IJQ60_10225 [Prevotella sp.]|nr:hypothetical protein [Prevotella sp.]MBR0264242.1 hypothetical protein [Prevotella sp.]
MRIILTIGCIFLSVICVAQRRQIGDARTILKSGKNFDKAEQMMTELLKDSANLENLRIYDVWLEAVEKQYGQLNEQMYKKEKVDTVKLFILTKRMFTVAERLDSLDMIPDKKGKVNLQYRKNNSERLMTYRPNLFFGGAYYVRKSDFNKAFDFFETYIDCAQQPLFETQDLMNTDARMGESAYWASYSGYRLNDPVKTLRYLELARRDSAKLESTLQYAAEAWHMLKDDTQYQAMLWEGFRLNPLSAYFFPRLIDSYTARGNYEQALGVANEAIRTDSLNQLFLFAKSTMQLNLRQYAECLKTSEQLINLNSEMADAYYNAGTACLNIVLNMDSRKHKKQIKRMYQRALPYMEAYRRLAPQEKDRWAPALYRIYFNLNMGKQFDEIDKLLKG